MANLRVQVSSCCLLHPLKHVNKETHDALTQHHHAGTYDL
ncbi:unnamed protein product [Brassica napus]|uniref:(rape) hypothetical protein n=1 Tax=Brassica napus TaxID=3708 RepID=A0A816IEC2_BRANA|nr:unnamed protein product [Brassica napus]